MIKQIFRIVTMVAISGIAASSIAWAQGSTTSAAKVVPKATPTTKGTTSSRARAAPASKGQAVNWSFAKTVDRMTDKTSCSMQLRGQPVLLTRDGLSLLLGRPYLASTSVTIRVDDQPVYEAQGRGGSFFEGLNQRSGKVDLPTQLNARRIRVQVTAPVSAFYDLNVTGMEQAWERLEREDCGPRLQRAEDGLSEAEFSKIAAGFAGILRGRYSIIGFEPILSSNDGQLDARKPYAVGIRAIGLDGEIANTSFPKDTILQFRRELDQNMPPEEIVKGRAEGFLDALTRNPNDTLGSWRVKFVSRREINGRVNSADISRVMAYNFPSIKETTFAFTENVLAVPVTEQFSLVLQAKVFLRGADIDGRRTQVELLAWSPSADFGAVNMETEITRLGVGISGCADLASTRGGQLLTRQSDMRNLGYGCYVETLIVALWAADYSAKRNSERYVFPIDDSRIFLSETNNSNGVAWALEQCDRAISNGRRAALIRYGIPCSLKYDPVTRVLKVQ
jgi:hypothetical protein